MGLLSIGSFFSIQTLILLLILVSNEGFFTVQGSTSLSSKSNPAGTNPGAVSSDGKKFWSSYTSTPTIETTVLNSNSNKNNGTTGSSSKMDSGSSTSTVTNQYSSFEEMQKFADNPFENNTNINVTYSVGDTAFLRCKVRNLGERSISWVRIRDWHILSSSKVIYTNDERFNILHQDGTDDWTLQIKYVQKRDSGQYSCLISSGNGIVSQIVHLFVSVPEAFILGNGEYHIEQGSTINLVCIIEKSPKPPEYIFWYWNSKMINYESSREVIIHTEPGSKTHSRLTIHDATIADSGNYSCKSSQAEPASIIVYVSQASGLFSGDKMAAIQRRNSGEKVTSTSSSPSKHLRRGAHQVVQVFSTLFPIILSTTVLLLSPI